MSVLDVVDVWEPEVVAVAVVGPEGSLDTHGPTDRPLRWASITKLVTALATLTAVEEGLLDLDEEAGPEVGAPAGATVRHLLAHASGLGFEEGAPGSEVGARRIYSNLGFEALGRLLEERLGDPVDRVLTRRVLRPLGIRGTHLEGSPAAGLVGPLADLVRLAAELLRPTLLDPQTFAEATTVQFPGLGGVLPGFGRQRPMDWGLGFELRDDKSPHWTGSRNSPRTFGHFGGSGSFLWVDPQADLACCELASGEFGPWAAQAWPAFSDQVLDAYADR